MARERRAVTPGGHVWYVRRRRARRRPLWSSERPSERFHGAEELPADEPPIPPWSSLWRTPNRRVGEPGYDRFNDERHAAVNAQIATVAGVLALNQVHRPWYVELQRQGLADAPRRVWRVQGWRRSGRLMGELTAAIHDGRIDSRGAVILPADGR
jgi:hypothetical protein